MSTRAIGERLRPDGETLVWVGLVLTTEFLLVATYVVLSGVTVRDWLLFVVPFVWINLGVWAVLRTTPAPAPAHKRRIAAVIAGGYFLLLAYFGGIVAPGGRAAADGLSLNLVGIPPGWSPAVVYSSGLVHLVFLPYKVVGYLALAYLVYATALDASGAVVGGLVGVFSCVSCSFPLVAGVVTGVVGSGGALAAAAIQSSYLLSTAVFVVTVGFLSVRPSLATVLQRR